ncbi:MAG: hypothetical protein U0Y10_15635 [Spirosomataceae bacterium]
MSNFKLEQEEQKNRQIAAGLTLTTNLVIFSLLLFIKIWQDIPLESSDGIEINFGTSNVGSGTIQTMNKPSDLPNNIESKPADKEEKKPEVKEIVKEKIPEPKVETKKTPPVEPSLKTSKEESPVKVPEKPTKKTETPVEKSDKNTKPVESKPVEKPARPQPTVETKALYKKGNGQNSNGTTGTNPQPGGNNNGDDKSGVGDKGNPEGKLDAKALYGKPGTGKGGNGNGNGTGASIAISGWTWSSKPVVNDDSDESGKIVFQVKLDEQGDIISVRIVEKTVSQSVAEVYKRAVEKINFVPTTSGERSATSTGTIVFIIKAK